MSKAGKILVVDDEQHIVEIVAFDLRRAGYEVVQADGGKSGLTAVEEHRPDLVISDVRMPSGSGVELLRWIKDRDPIAPPFMFMTAFSDISADEALDQGAEAFLNKPFEAEEILVEVERILVPRPERWAKAPDYEAASRLRLDADAGLAGEGAPRITLGSGGAFVELAEDFPDTLEIVAFKLPAASGELSGMARVRWVRHEGAPDRPPGVGLEFLYLEDACRLTYMAHLIGARPRAFVPLGL